MGIIRDDFIKRTKIIDLKGYRHTTMQMNMDVEKKKRNQLSTSTAGTYSNVYYSTFGPSISNTTLVGLYD